MRRQIFSLGLFIPIILMISSSAPTGFSDKDSAYEVLQSYGFPIGLLPKIVEGYTLDSNGKFLLNLDGSCTIDIPDAYPVKYSSKITGRISNERLTDLNGITVKILFIWWDINAISVSGNDLVFMVGPFSASYPSSNFIENPGCEGRLSELVSLV